MKDYAGKTIWIIGASSGIGRALAMELDSRGANLILSARNEQALNTLSASLKNENSVVPFDAADKNSFAGAFSNLRKIDSVVYLAAAYTPGKIEDIKPDDVAAAISINLEAPYTLLRHLIPLYKKQGRGQIALCGSVAGYVGLPGGQPYSATKAGIINLAQSLRSEMADENIDVRLISPGFVRTGLTDKNDFSMPMIIEPEEAAKAIADGLSGNNFEIHFPKKFTFIMKIISMLPYCLYFLIVRMIKR
ncbi:MAG: short-chain dehydrogenase [Micavibrio aeruginosavorus]|uniref:Short-chain dehydrogenase n=1 Tax=Micavibrio aeruginosavorus TaxID=349221 RepID=A0A2W4ZNP4_9BACT|nr:MAG: short-chain dehydrogenase [Micavibrio aeruginosavorus]